MNVVVLTGYLGDNFETNYPQEKDENKLYARNSLGITQKWTDKSGNKVEHTDWIPIAVFGKRAKTLIEHSGKGHQLSIQGKLNTSKYKDENGEQRYSWGVIVKEFTFGKKKENASNANNTRDDNVAQNSIQQANINAMQQNNQIPPNEFQEGYIQYMDYAD